MTWKCRKVTYIVWTYSCKVYFCVQRKDWKNIQNVNFRWYDYKFFFFIFTAFLKFSPWACVHFNFRFCFKSNHLFVWIIFWIIMTIIFWWSSPQNFSLSVPHSTNQVNYCDLGLHCFWESMWLAGKQKLSARFPVFCLRM